MDTTSGPSSDRRRLEVRPAGRLVRAARDVDGLLRVHFVFFSALLPVLGGVSVRRTLSPGAIAALVAIGLCFHVFAYVLNDVVDLPIDRTQPLRRRDPLVRGVIRPGQALGLALAAVPLGLALTLAPPLRGGWAAAIALCVGFGCMAVYDVYGKRAAFPPLTDAVQGVAWGSLAVVGALAVGGPTTAGTWVAAAHAALFILLINGIHGGLRDLANDVAGGARTTAIVFGARPRAAGGIDVPPAVAAFAFTVTALVLAVDGAAVWGNAFGYDGATRQAMLAVVGALAVLALGLLGAVLRPHGVVFQVGFRLQMFLLLMLLPIVFFPSLSPAVRWTLGVLLALSVVAFFVGAEDAGEEVQGQRAPEQEGRTQ
ncbi:MAG: UbiA family prenyltransferase [Ardenticatenales bacterium]